MYGIVYESQTYKNRPREPNIEKWRSLDDADRLQLPREMAAICTYSRKCTLVNHITVLRLSQ